MIDTPIRFVSAQPDELQFIWQCQVYLYNFLALGIPPHQCTALFGLQDRVPSRQLNQLIQDFPEVDIQLYSDTRGPEGRGYAPSIQPHLIVKAYQQHPEWHDEILFFHDCDMVFRRLPDFDIMLQSHPGCCLLSDTTDYIGYGYLHTCCEKIRQERPELPPDHLLHHMCEVVGIDVDLVKANESSSGGAQYLLQDVDVRYWEKVYRDAVNLKTCFETYAVIYKLKHEIRHYIQAWTAGMWAYLWNLWLHGQPTVIHQEMGFVFSGASSSEPAPILHMAGLPDDLKHSHFNKQAWVHVNPIDVLRVQPFVFDHIPESTVAREYVDHMRDMAGIRPWRERPLAPAKQWRVLVWQTASAFAWDVQQLRFQVEPPARVIAPIESGHAGAGYEVISALDNNPAVYWGGRPQVCDGGIPSYYVGVKFDTDVLPKCVTLIQRDGPHHAHVGLLQYSHNGANWVTAHASKLNSTGKPQLLFYRAKNCHEAPQWRIRSTQMTTGWGWDVHRLCFLYSIAEQVGEAFSSGHAYPNDPSQYGSQYAFQDTHRYWGGRPDDNGHFYIGIAHTQCLCVNRVILEQHAPPLFATGIDIQCSYDGVIWHTVKTVTNLDVGINDILLFDAQMHIPDKVWYHHPDQIAAEG